MAIELRRYQQELLRRVQDALASNPEVRLMMQLPTGGGKTIIAGALLAKWLSNGRKAVWLTHRKELAEQTREMLTDDGISAMTNVSWTPGTDAPAMAGGVVILMAQTVGRRTARREVWNRYRSTDLMIIDEAHHAAAKGWERAIRQWSGPIVGMTATPWRLSKKEGFDHLFAELLCGRQVADLQESGSLCNGQVLLPPPKQRIAGGAVDHTGDYTEKGIEQANSDRPDVMTAGALRFWQEYAGNRQTIAYAVSVEHAHNLASVFNNAGVRAAVLLGDTNLPERDAAISGFKDGNVKVLVSVLVATEGFDLPDASCILISRPTMSLALYLQMVGRGLRPKPDGGDCVILDLAGNSVAHGLPEDYREWSLKSRGKEGEGEAPVIWCEKCFTVSHAASHQCSNCGAPFGKDCDRCGKWRAWKRWQYETHCGNVHQLVCDLCHIDAHVQAHLPIAPPLDKLIEHSENSMTTTTDSESELAGRLSGLFKELLESERQAITGTDYARRGELRRRIEESESVLKDNTRQYALFNEHIAGLPKSEHPADPIQQGLMIAEYVGSLRSELANWRRELAELESRTVDKQAIFDSARIKAMRLLRQAAEAMDLLPERTDNNRQKNTAGSVSVSSEENWYKLSELGNTISVKGQKPLALRFPNGDEKSSRFWTETYTLVVVYLFDKEHLSPNAIPKELEKFFSSQKQKIHRGRTIRLENGLFLIARHSPEANVSNSHCFLETCGEDPAQFQVRLRTIR